MAFTRRPLRRQSKGSLGYESTACVDDYMTLQLQPAFLRRRDYAEACRELALLLRKLYAAASKSLQAVLFDDTIVAFQRLPLMGGSEQKAAAHLLLRAAEAVLPKQRRQVAALEFKQACLTWTRNYRRLYGSGGGGGGDETDDDDAADHAGAAQLPLDVMHSVLRFLDAVSLARVAAVCSSFRHLAADERLWRAQMLEIFGEHGAPEACPPDAPVGLSWAAGPFTSNRADCPVCNSIQWVQIPHTDPGGDVPYRCRHQRVMISAKQVVGLFLRKFARGGVLSSSDSDDSSDGEDLPEYQGRAKLWSLAFP
eukprot:jgi/Mesen1/2764/ME000170S01880